MMAKRAFSLRSHMETDSELTTSPTPITIFSRLINRLEVYKTYPPQTQDDMKDIISIADALKKACGA